jgi:hypothetical protein
MATGTGLPALNGAPVLAQAPPSGGAESLFSAQAWTQIAGAGEQLAKAGGDYLKVAEHRAQAASIADFENRHREEYVRASDKFYGKPAEFESWATGHNEGVLSSVDPGMVDYAKKYLGGLFVSGLSSQLSVKRSKDETLNTESLNARLKTADDDVQSLASGGKLGDDTGKAAVRVYNGVLDTAVQTRAMSPEKAALLREDLSERAQGNVVRNGLEKVYAEKGYEEARKWLTSSVVEMGSEYKFSDKLLRGGLAWLRSEESAHRGERDAVSREWAAAKGQASTLPNDVMLDLAQRAYSVGNIRVAQDVEANMRGLEIAKQFRALPLSDRVTIASTGEAPADNFTNRLVRSESSGRPDRVNELGYAGLHQFGAPRLADLGVYQPGPTENLDTWSRTSRYSGGKWSGTFTIPGFPDVRTLDDFRASPDAQKAVYAAHTSKMDQEIKSNGFDRYEGQTVGGVLITRDGLRAMLHLGGVGGARDALESDGTVNGKDINGKSVLDYARMGVGTSDTVQKFTNSRPGLIALGKLKSEMGNDIDHSIADLTSANRKTEFPSLDEIYALGIQAAAVGTPEQKRKVAELAVIADAGARFSILTPRQRADATAEWTKRLEAGAPEFSRKLDAILTSSDKKIGEAYQSDPYGAAYRFANGVTALPSIDFGRADLPDVLKAKIAQQAQIRADQDLPPFSALRPTEAAGLAAQLTQGNPAQAGAALSALASLPREMFVATMADKPIQAALDGMVRSYDPAKLNAGMTALDRVYRTDPLGFKAAFGGDTLSRLQVWQSFRQSESPQEIADRFKRADDPSFADARKRLIEEAGKEANTVTPGNIAKAMYQVDHPVLGSLPLTGPSAPVDGLQSTALKVEYDKIYGEFRAFGLTTAKAHDQTISRLQTTWGASEINGNQIMRNPPERFYQDVDGSKAWMKTAIEADLAGVKGPRFTRTPGDLGPTSVENWSYRVLPDATTEADIAAGRTPSYVVNVIDGKTGRLDIPLDPNGAPMRYKWDDAAALESSRSSFNRLRFLKLNSSPNAGGIESRQMADPLGEIGPR